MNLRRVVIESPFRATEYYSREQHKTYLDFCMADSLMRHEAPIASHALWTPFLDDDDPLERAHGIACGYEWGAHCDAVAVYGDLGISPGMSDAIAHYEALGKPIEWRRLAEQLTKAILDMGAE